MKREWLAGFIILSLLILAFVFNDEATTETDGARIYFDDTEHHFGKVKEGDRLMHAFTFRNIGTKDLVIKTVVP
jgi:hypothetical protein